MRILGIDPGYGLVGWGIIDFDKAGKLKAIDYGVIETDKSNELPDRLLEIHIDMTELLEQFKPDLVGIETLIFHKNITTGIQVAEARGVITLAAREFGIPTIHVNPSQIKAAISGYGKATKRQMQENVKLLCGLDDIPRPDDAADALAVAICAQSVQ